VEPSLLPAWHTATLWFSQLCQTLVERKCWTQWTCVFLLVCDHKIGDKQEEECMQQPTRKLGFAGASADKMAVVEAESYWQHCWNLALYHHRVRHAVPTPSCTQLICRRKTHLCQWQEVTVCAQKVSWLQNSGCNNTTNLAGCVAGKPSVIIRVL